MGRAGKAGDVAAFAVCAELWDAMSPSQPTRELVVGDGWGLAAWLDLVSRATPSHAHHASDIGSIAVDVPGSVSDLTAQEALWQAQERETVITRDASMAATRLHLRMQADDSDGHTSGEDQEPRGHSSSRPEAPDTPHGRVRQSDSSGARQDLFGEEAKTVGVRHLLEAAKEAQLLAEQRGGRAVHRHREETMQELWIAMADLAATSADAIAMARTGGLLSAGPHAIKGTDEDGDGMAGGEPGSMVRGLLELCPRPSQRAAYTIAGVLRAGSGRAASHRLVHRVLYDMGALHLCLPLSALPREPPLQQVVDASLERTESYVHGKATPLLAAETLFAIRSVGLVRSGTTIHRLLAWLEACGMGFGAKQSDDVLLQALMCSEAIGDAESAFASMRAGGAAGIRIQARHIASLHRCLLRNGDADGIAALASSSLVEGMDDMQSRLQADHAAIVRAFGNRQ
jgi:hypothetical protein